MFEKIKKSYLRPYTDQLRDVRAWGFLVFGIIALMVTWSGIKAIQTNYELQKQISTLHQQNQVQDLQNNNLKLQNQYLNTNQFLELTARREFGLAAPGETELVVPKNVALAHITTTNQSTTQSVSAEAIRPTYQRHFQAWINFFLHRPNSD